VALAKTEAPEGEVAPWFPAETKALDVTLPEVKQMWWFLDGSIQAVEVRHHLWKSWGFCPRHTWMNAVVNVELRWLPMSTAILYEDLTARAARTLGSPAVSDARRVRRLRPRATCFSCDFLALGPSRSGDPKFEEQQALVNGRRRTVPRLVESRGVWEPRSCPECAGGEGPVCRPHLLVGAAPPGADLPERLGDVADRLRHFVRSMTWHGPEPTAAANASFVEALGWFGGWGFPLAAIDAGSHRRGRRQR
jgi:hypothetical protein